MIKKIMCWEPPFSINTSGFLASNSSLIHKRLLEYITEPMVTIFYVRQLVCNLRGAIRTRPVHMRKNSRLLHHDVTGSRETYLSSLYECKRPRPQLSHGWPSVRSSQINHTILFWLISLSFPTKIHYLLRTYPPYPTWAGGLSSKVLIYVYPRKHTTWKLAHLDLIFFWRSLIKQSLMCHT